MLRVLVAAFMAAARLGELAYSRRNIAAAGVSREGEWSRATFPLIVATHTAAIAGTALFGSRRGNPLFLAALAAAQPLRLWVLVSLGHRWNARAAVPEQMRVETRGPYALVRHPNYSIVALELFCLPAAFGLGALALAVSAVNAVLLAGRIREEEALLSRLEGYDAHFERLPRFIPGLF